MTPDEYFASELDKHKRAFDGGFYPALLDALWLCGANNVPLPEWVWHVQAQLEHDYAKGRAGGARGRTGGRRAAAEMDRIHYLRWSSVRHWLDKDNRKCLKLGGYKPTREGVFAFVSDRLKCSKAQGSPDAVKDSYKLVETARRAGALDRFAAAADSLRCKPGGFILRN